MASRIRNLPPIQQRTFRTLPIAFTGSFFPFSRTKAERARTQDGRASLEERYTGVDDYLKKYAAAASDLSRAGYLREADIGPMTERARKEWDYWAKRP